MDRITKEKRSWNMSRIKAKNTSPERTVRSIIHSLGLRFRLHSKKLPGHPDIILPKLKTVVFVHGCFWHRHEGCKYTYTPKTKISFWEKKFISNVLRDNRVSKEINRLGWKIFTVWECELKDREKLTKQLRDNLCSISHDTGQRL